MGEGVKKGGWVWQNILRFSEVGTKMCGLQIGGGGCEFFVSILILLKCDRMHFFSLILALTQTTKVMWYPMVHSPRSFHLV